MAEFADSERALWQAAEQIRQMRVEYMNLQRVVIALARRQAGVLVVDEYELTGLPPGSSLQRADHPGRTIFRVVQDEPAEPGQAG